MLSTKTGPGLRHARQCYLANGETPLAELVGGVVSRSWRRCLDAGLAPVGRLQTPLQLNASQVARATGRQSELVAHARPVMEYLHAQTRNTGSMVILADDRGVLLQTLGDTDFLGRAERVALMQGASWHESQRGTNAIDQLGVSQWQYDRAGNLIDDGQHQYRWNAQNQLIAITGADLPAGGISYSYDGLGRRSSRSAAGWKQQYLWCDDIRICAVKEQETIKARYYSQGEEHAGSKRYYHRDQLGSIIETSNAAGISQARLSYSPYGETEATAGSTDQLPDHRYAGMWYEPAANLYLTHYRAYDPVRGRWLSRDPIGEAGGINPYQYADSNPISNIDPLGLTPGTAAGAAIGTAIAPGPGTALGALIGTGVQVLVGGAAMAAILSTSGDSPSDRSRAVPYPDRRRGKYTCVCRANKDDRSPDNCSNDNQDFAMGYGEGATLGEAKRAAEKDAKEKLGAKSTHHIQCRCTAPNGDRVIPHG